MALDFLNSPNSSDASAMSGIAGGGGMGNIQNLLNLVGGGLQVGNTFKGYQPTAAEGQQTQAMSNQSALLQALLNPNSTIYKNVLAGQTQQLNNTTQQGLNDLMQMQRKAQLMGRGTYFNPERQDESISQYLSKQADTNANTGRSNALTQILGAAQGYGNQASTYGNMIKNQQAAQDVNKSSTSNGLSQIGQMLPMLIQAGAMFA